MSLKAMLYVKELRKAPNGDPVTLGEKALLWYIADCHNDERMVGVSSKEERKRIRSSDSPVERNAAWFFISTLAEHNGISDRRAREILAECIRKGIIWRDERLRDTGCNTSNFWRFNQVDGEPTQSALVAEEERRIRGELAASRSNATKSGRRNPQSSGGTGCELSQGEDANSRNGRRESSQGGDASSRTPECGSSQEGDAEVRREGMREFASLELQVELPSDAPTTLDLTSEGKQAEPSTAAAVDIGDEAKEKTGGVE